MISIEELKEYSENLMFKMKDSEYKTLQEEFDVFLNWMDKIGKIDNIENVEPMYFPYKKENVLLRNDESITSLTKEEILLNSNCVKDDKISVPKVII